MELPKRYDPKISEEKWQKYWGDNKIYQFDIKDKKKEVYSKGFLLNLKNKDMS